jgi:outer membrane protein assembly factor BamB
VSIGTGATQKWQVKITGGADQSLAWDDYTRNDQYSGILTPPTVAGGRVFVSVTHTHEVVALDANNGSELWRFTAGGRVDGPPTIYGDLCLFGSRDGWVYCLNTASGTLIWRFFLGQNFDKMMACGAARSSGASSLARISTT